MKDGLAILALCIAGVCFLATVVTYQPGMPDTVAYLLICVVFVLLAILARVW